MASSIKSEYAASSALTVTLAGLASDTNLLAGRESNEVDNTTGKYLDYLLAGTITTGTSPTASKQIEVWVVGILNDTTYPDVFDGVDSAETITSAEIKASVCRMAARIATTATSNAAYPFGPVSVANLFGGVLPRKFVVFPVHNTDAALNGTAGNHSIHVTPVYATSS